MTPKTEERHDALRRRLVDLAEQRIVDGGIAAVKARDLAKSANCALGAIYNVFDDLMHIVLEVNSRSFKLLDQKLRRDLNQPVSSPTEQLILIAECYLDFALDEPNRWRSLFDVPFSDNLEVPQWYWDQLNGLYSHIADPVARCFPHLDDTDQALMTRALFSSVHGIISFGTENRAEPVQRREMAQMIHLMIQHVTGNR